MTTSYKYFQVYFVLFLKNLTIYKIMKKNKIIKYFTINFVKIFRFFLCLPGMPLESFNWTLCIVKFVFEAFFFQSNFLQIFSVDINFTIFRIKD